MTNKWLFRIQIIFTYFILVFHLKEYNLLLLIIQYISLYCLSQNYMLNIINRPVCHFYSNILVCAKLYVGMVPPLWCAACWIRLNFVRLRGVDCPLFWAAVVSIYVGYVGCLAGKTRVSPLRLSTRQVLTGNHAVIYSPTFAMIYQQDKFTSY